MSNPVFLSIPGGHGLARAAMDPSGQWAVETFLADTSVTCLAADPLQPGVIYAGTPSGMLRSADFGQTWLPAGLPGQVIKAICASPSAAGTVYAGTRPPGLFVSHNGGADWRELPTFRKTRAFWWRSPAEGWPFTPYVQAISLSPTDSNRILVGIEAGAVLRSSDGGATWEGHRPGALRDCHTLVAHAATGDWFYEGGGTGAGAACSQDSGRTWRQLSAGLDRHYGWSVAADPAQPDTWYAALSPDPYKAHGDGNAQAFIFRSCRGGPWQKLGGGLPQPLDFMPYALLTDPAVPGQLYAGLSSGEVWRSPDQGETWKRLPFRLPGIHRTMILV